MVGSALVRLLEAKGYSHVLTPNQEELELSEKGLVDAYFNHHRPEYVFMIAAKVGGIGANVADPVGFLLDNLKIETNLFEACHAFGTKKNLFLGSSCIYPRESPQPMKEEYLMAGPLEPTNEGYALSKIVGIRLAQYYYQQYGMLTVCPVPSNIYGTNDHYDLEKSHVLSALVKKITDATLSGDPEVILWGTGLARREFIHVDDVASALLFFMGNVDTPDIVNVGWGEDISIKDLAELVAAKVGFKGNIIWDKSKPDGMPRKCMDTSKLQQLGFRPSINLPEGIERTIKEYKALAEGSED